MLLTRLYRPHDHTSYIRKGEAPILPADVGGMVWMTAMNVPLQFFGIILFNGVAVILQLAVPYVIKLIIDKMAAAPEGLNGRMDYIMPAFLLLLLAIGGRFIAQYVVWTLSYFWRPGRRRMSHSINTYVLGHSPSFFENDLSGRIIQKSISLFSGTEQILSAILWNWSGTAFFFVVALAMLGAISLPLAGIGVLWFAVLFAGSRYVGRNIARNARMTSESRSQLVGRMADAIINIRNVLQFAHQPHEIEGLAARENAVVNREQYAYLTILDVRMFNQVMSLLALAGIIGTCLYMWSQGRATVGDIAMVSTLAILVVQRAIDVVENLPEVLDSIGTARDSLDTLVKPRGMVDQPNAPALQPGAGAIRFDNITFAYPEAAGRPVFQNFDLAIRAGERVGLVGVSGSGKSTLVSLLLRMHDVQQGSVEIDGQNIAHVTQSSLRRGIAFIPQETLLFHRSVRENIAYGKLDAADEEIEAAARAAQAHGFISVLPHGYKTMVGERGVKLSGGQRQRIAIARALLKNAPILVLDEATSALDSEAEKEIQDAITLAMQGKTVIAIAHRLSTIASLDRLVVLEHGRIAEQGAHAELIAAGGIYANLWRRQSGGFLAVC
jgi:ABC-type multidrug transport system fused ATPase/permease subunit